MIKIDWDELRSVHNHLLTVVKDETDIVFVIITQDGKSKKSVAKFKDFLSIFWSLSENKEFHVITLIVQDKEGRILYRHKQRNSGNEEIPDGGNANIVQHWSALTPAEKATYMTLLVSQIQAYER